VKNLDTGEKFFINDVDQYCKFDEFDTFENGGLQFEVKMCGNNRVTPPSGGSFTVYEMEVLERKVRPCDYEKPADANTLYLISPSLVVSLQGDSRRWNFAKRYSDFVSLHEILSDAGYGVGQIQKALPPKRWFGNLEGDVVTFRQRALERYMTLCLQHASPDDCSAVRDFLASSTIPVRGAGSGLGAAPLPITPPSLSRGASMSSDQEVYGSARGTGSDGFEPRSLNEEERALSNMLALADVDDDGTPTQVKDISQYVDNRDDEDDGEFITIRRAQLQDLLNERETLYAEILRYKDENANLFRDLGSAEDLCDELQDKIDSLDEGKKEGEGGA